MYTADSDNHDKMYRQDIEDGYYKDLSDYFSERYDASI